MVKFKVKKSGLILSRQLSVGRKRVEPEVVVALVFFKQRREIKT